jgi:hypothetical protein
MRMEFLTTGEAIQADWEELKPLFRKVVDRATYGEFTIDDLYRMAMDGSIVISLVREAGKIIMALAFEFRHYPQKLAVNYLAMGGKKSHEVMARFLKEVGEWAKKAGADWIEACCSKGMARIFAQHHFVTTYQLVRLDLNHKGETT